MDLFEGTKMYYIRVLIYSCDSGEDVRKVDVNREGRVCTDSGRKCAPGASCLSLTLPSLLQSSMSASVSCVSELCQCGRDVRRQREDACRQRSGSAQTAFRKCADNVQEVRRQRSGKRLRGTG